MTTASRESVLRKMGEAMWAPEGSSKRVALLESAVHEADALGDLELAYEVRDELLEAACWGGAPDKMLVCFAWMLGQSDKAPAEFPEADLLWKYKWIASEVPEFHHIARAQIDAMVTDMDARFRRAGSTMRAVWQTRALLAEAFGELEQLRAHAATWQDTARDDLSDCEACEMSEYVRWQVALGEDEKAVEAAAPLLRHQYECTEVPHITFGVVLLPLLRLSRLEEAVRHHREGHRLVCKLPGKHVDNFAAHIRFLALTGNLTRGLELLAQHLPAACAHPAPGPRLRFFTVAALLLRRVADAGLSAITLKTPDAFQFRSADHRYDPAALSAALLDHARADAARFDQRNGNDSASRGLAAEMDRVAIAVDFPLSRVEDIAVADVNRG